MTTASSTQAADLAPAGSSSAVTATATADTPVAAGTPTRAQAAAPRLDGARPIAAPVSIAGAPLVAWQSVGVAEAAPRFAVPEPLPVHLAERIETAIDQVVLPELRAVAAGAWQQLLHDGELVRKLDAVQQQLLATSDQRHTLMASGIGLTGGLSIGYVVWLIRGGVLVSSMLSALPAWQMIDPLPVLAARRRGSGDDDDDANGGVEELFDDAAAPPPPPARADADEGPAP